MWNVIAGGEEPNQVWELERYHLEICISSTHNTGSKTRLLDRRHPRWEAASMWGGCFPGEVEDRLHSMWLSMQMHWSSPAEQIYFEYH